MITQSILDKLAQIYQECGWNFEFALGEIKNPYINEREVWIYDDGNLVAKITILTEDKVDALYGIEDIVSAVTDYFNNLC